MDITIESLVFLIFGALTLGAGVLVVTSRNLFHSGLYLMMSLFGVAGLFVLLAAPLLAGFQVVVYIGAIAILIIVAIMLTPGLTQIKTLFNEQWMVNLAAAVIVFLVLVSVITPLMDDVGVDNWNADFTEDHPKAVAADSMTTLGEQLVDPDYFMLPFEVASVLLMAAMIGAVLLVNPGQAEDESVVPPEGEEV
ncbi:MAG: NADH-quinone oxidoreductase subunit J [Chloroflexi bacterium]|nr:NADH-quinone oxidoreductase subunit J [Chloroflexota bacterium]